MAEFPQITQCNFQCFNIFSLRPIPSTVAGPISSQTFTHPTCRGGTLCQHFTLRALKLAAFLHQSRKPCGRSENDGNSSTHQVKGCRSPMLKESQQLSQSYTQESDIGPCVGEREDKMIR
ncbi:hypothetical protein FGO68_gene4568 [Halteria grandinella]|uniref:Uncharacterized protein n=1 Tax=Halteria grandinella TaxID=5974 RepID=A0A8J8T0P6_HALGN|nr:hypothetical protein FGO68_gene4568 [Halteria grandinella]